MTEKTIEHALSAAADDVVAEFSDGILRACKIHRRGNLKWEVEFAYGALGEFLFIPSLTIEEDYGHIPDHELLKAKMRAHLLAHPPKSATH